MAGLNPYSSTRSYSPNTVESDPNGPMAGLVFRSGQLIELQFDYDENLARAAVTKILERVTLRPCALPFPTSKNIDPLYDYVTALFKFPSTSSKEIISPPEAPNGRSLIDEKGLARLVIANEVGLGAIDALARDFYDYGQLGRSLRFSPTYRYYFHSSTVWPQREMGCTLQTISGTGLTCDGDFTFELWFFPMATNTTLFRKISGGPILDFDANMFSGYGGPDLGLGGFGKTESTMYKWAHLAISRQGTALKIFINGAEISSVVYGGTVDFNGVALGNAALTYKHFNGVIDEIRLTNGVSRYPTAFSLTPGQRLEVPYSAGVSFTPTVYHKGTDSLLALVEYSIAAPPTYPTTLIPVRSRLVKIDHRSKSLSSYLDLWVDSDPPQSTSYIINSALNRFVGRLTVVYDDLLLMKSGGTTTSNFYYDSQTKIVAVDPATMLINYSYWLPLGTITPTPYLATTAGKYFNYTSPSLNATLDPYYSNVVFDLDPYHNIGSGPADRLGHPVSVNGQISYVSNLNDFGREDNSGIIFYDTVASTAVEPDFALTGDFTIEFLIKFIGSSYVTYEGGVGAAPGTGHLTVPVGGDPADSFSAISLVTPVSLPEGNINVVFSGSSITYNVLGQTYTQSYPNTSTPPFGGTNAYIKTNNFYHVAISRIGSTIYLALNGIILSTLTSASPVPASSLVFGQAYEGDPNIYTTTALTETIKNTTNRAFTLHKLKITKGVGRYSSNFTVPELLIPKVLQTGSTTYSGVGNGTIGSISTFTYQAVPEIWTMTATSSTNFTVTGSVTGASLAATVNTNYTNNLVSFRISSGSTPFVAGDVFTFTVISILGIPSPLSLKIELDEVELGKQRPGALPPVNTFQIYNRTINAYNVATFTPEQTSPTVGFELSYNSMAYNPYTHEVWAFSTAGGTVGSTANVGVRWNISSNTITPIPLQGVLASTPRFNASLSTQTVSVFNLLNNVPDFGSLINKGLLISPTKRMGSALGSLLMNKTTAKHARFPTTTLIGASGSATLGSGAWIVDLFYNNPVLQTEPNIDVLVSERSSTAPGFEIFVTRTAATCTVGFRVHNGTTTVAVPSLSTGLEDIGQDNWRHIALVRSSNKVYGFINGIKTHELTLASTSTTVSGTFSDAFIGCSSALTNFATGNIQQLRFGRTVPWTDTFTPPTTLLAFFSTDVVTFDAMHVLANGQVIVPVGISGNAGALHFNADGTLRGEYGLSTLTEDVLKNTSFSTVRQGSKFIVLEEQKQLICVITGQVGTRTVLIYELDSFRAAPIKQLSYYRNFADDTNTVSDPFTSQIKSGNNQSYDYNPRSSATFGIPSNPRAISHSYLRTPPAIAADLPLPSSSIGAISEEFVQTSGVGQVTSYPGGVNDINFTGYDTVRWYKIQHDGTRTLKITLIHPTSSIKLSDQTTTAPVDRLVALGLYTPDGYLIQRSDVLNNRTQTTPSGDSMLPVAGYNYVVDYGSAGVVYELPLTIRSVYPAGTYYIGALVRITNGFQGAPSQDVVNALTSFCTYEFDTKAAPALVGPLKKTPISLININFNAEPYTDQYSHTVNTYGTVVHETASPIAGAGSVTLTLSQLGPAVYPPDPTVMFIGHFNGADGSAVMVDSSTHNRTITPDSNARIRTAQSEYGGASLGLLVNSGVSIGVGTGASLTALNELRIMTLEMSVRPTINFAPVMDEFSLFFISYTTTSGFTRGIRFDIFGLDYYNGIDGLAVSIDNGSTYLTTGYFPPINQWTKLALSIDGVAGSIRVHANGTLIFNSTTIFNQISTIQSVNAISIGTPSSSVSFKGYIDEVRLSAGIARYGASNYTPGTSEF